VDGKRPCQLKSEIKLLANQLGIFASLNQGMNHGIGNEILKLMLKSIYELSDYS
jgi:hypothetical protein